MLKINDSATETNCNHAFIEHEHTSNHKNLELNHTVIIDKNVPQAEPFRFNFSTAELSVAQAGIQIPNRSHGDVRKSFSFEPTFETTKLNFTKISKSLDCGDVKDVPKCEKVESSNNLVKTSPKTGEEDEDMIYIQRAKLYRYLEGEWKKRGVGNVKILYHKEMKKFRVLMRRDQFSQICLNHILNADVEYRRKDDKSWLFVVNDFSEGVLDLGIFTLLFETEVIAAGFVNLIKNVLYPANAITFDETDADAAENTKLTELSPEEDLTHNEFGLTVVQESVPANHRDIEAADAKNEVNVSELSCDAGKSSTCTASSKTDEENNLEIKTSRLIDDLSAMFVEICLNIGDV